MAALTHYIKKYGFNFKKLEISDDYPVWRQHMEHSLRAARLWDYVAGVQEQPEKPLYGYQQVAPTYTILQRKKQQADHEAAVKAALDAGQEPPTEMPERISKEEAKDLLEEIEVQIKEHKIWTDADSEAYLMISSMVGSSALQRVMGSTTSRQLWDALQAEYETKGPRILLADYKIASSSKITDFKTPGEYVKAVTEAASRLSQMNFVIPDHNIVLNLLQGLTPEWHSVKSRYLDRSERLVSLQDMKNLILQGIPESPGQTKPTAEPLPMAAAAGSKARFGGSCNHCGKPGHKEFQCFTKHPELRSQKRKAESTSESPTKRSRTETSQQNKDK
jgi:hypothetical protein